MVPLTAGAQNRLTYRHRKKYTAGTWGALGGDLAGESYCLMGAKLLFHTMKVF